VINQKMVQQNPPSFLSSARERLSSISTHIMGASNPSVFTAATVAAAPEDPLFGLMKAYREDPSDKKVDLGIGAYRDNNAKPWILPVVKKVSFLYALEQLACYASAMLACDDCSTLASQPTIPPWTN
jgi:hypothetical protein